MHIDRRTLLGATLAATSPLLLPRSFARAAGGDTPFSLGVASGEPWPDGFVIWTRLAPRPMATDGLGGMAGPATVRWEVAADPAMKHIVRHGEVTTSIADAHAVHVELTGLRPGRPYWYRFTALGAQSAVGRAHTAPARGAAVSEMKIVLASCCWYEAGYYSAFRHMAAERPDVVLFLGDYIYEYSASAQRKTVRRHDRFEDVTDLAGYRIRYAQTKTDLDLQGLHATAPWLMIWDDHEVQNDYAGRWSNDPGTPDDVFAVTRAAGYQAYYEHMPLRRRSLRRPDGEVRIYDRYRFGDLVEISMLDGRQYRSIQACPTPTSRKGHVAPAACADLADPGRTYLGHDQEAWLYDGFARADARWNLIIQPIRLAPYAQKAADGQIGVFTDSWDAHGQSRQRLLTAMDQSRLANPVVFGGDLHASAASDILASDTDPAAKVLTSEFVGTSITSDNPGPAMLETLALNPHTKMLDVTTHGYMSATLRRDGLETRYQVISDREDSRATVATKKAFVVEAGRPGLVQRDA